MKVNTEVVFPILKHVTIFAGMTDDNLMEITRNCEVIDLPAGAIVIRENTPGTNLLIILQGRVKVILGLETDRLEVVEFGPGNCLGEVSMIGILNHSASVVTVEPTELLVISRQVLMDTFKEDKELFSILVLNLARELARRLHRTDLMLLEYGRKLAETGNLDDAKKGWHADKLL